MIAVHADEELALLIRLRSIYKARLVEVEERIKEIDSTQSQPGVSPADLR